MDTLDETLQERITRKINFTCRSWIRDVSENEYFLSVKISNKEKRQKTIDACIDALIDDVKPYVKDAYEYLKWHPMITLA